MSVQLNTYVMRGVLLPYADMKGRHDVLEPYMDSASDDRVRDGITVLYDGMNGQYVAIGRVIAKTGNHQGFDAPITLCDNDALTSDLRTKLGDLLRVLGLTDKLDGRGLCWHIDTLVISHYR